MTKKVTERRIVDVLMCALRDSHHVGREVKHYEKRIDLVAMCSTSRELWAIEAKVENWGKALSQAIVNLAATERSYIAMYEGFVHRVPLDFLKEHGIGLISVGTKWGDVQVLLEADESPFVNRLASERIKLGILS